MGARISVRLQEPLLKQLNREARKRRIRRSDLVREALEAFLSGEVARVDSLPYERVRDLVAVWPGGRRIWRAAPKVSLGSNR